MLLTCACWHVLTCVCCVLQARLVYALYNMCVLTFADLCGSRDARVCAL